MDDQSTTGGATTSDQAAENEPVEPANVPITRLPQTFFSRRWWWVTLLVLVFIGVFVRLGIWQLDRRQQRLASNAAYLAQISQSPLPLDASLVTADAEEVVDRSAFAQGRYDHQEQIVLTQQSWLGRPGAHLVTPLVFENGQTAVLVDRGWIPAADAEQGDLSQFDEPGPQTVEGTIQQSQILSGGRETEVDGPQQRWYRIDVEAIQDQMPYALLPFYLVQTPPEGVQDDLPYRVAVEFDLSEGPHLGYAIQWFLFAAVLSIGYARFVSTQDARLRRRRASSDSSS
jgi:surfeit locus 1 family protein